MSVVQNSNFEELCKILKDSDLINILITHIFEIECIEYINNQSQIDIEFEIDPPKPIPLTRQIVCNFDTNPIHNSLIPLNEIELNHIMITKIFVIDKDYDFLKSGDIYINYIMRTDEISYFRGLILIPNNWNSSVDSLKIFKSIIEF